MRWVERRLIPWLERRYRISQPGLRVVGPLRVGVTDDRSLLERALAFRREQNLLRASYLEDSVQLGVEERLRLDERSVHFVGLRDDEIVATLRATFAPFELDDLVPELRTYENREYDRYIEAGRLCTAVRLPNKGRVASQLIIRAILWAVLVERCRGCVAVCKRDKVRYLCRFGFSCIAEDVSIPRRGGAYAVIAASRTDLVWGLAAAARGKGPRASAERKRTRENP